MTSPTRPVALVTGASSGIGADLARELARDGHDLVLTARRQEPMQALAAELEAYGATSLVIAADLSQPGGAAQLAAQLEARGLTIDVLVDNAGLGAIGPFDRMDTVRIGEMLQVNIVALTELTRLVLPGMVARGRGRVMLVGSTAGFQPGPGMAVYFATKAYVLSLSEAMHEELKPHGIKVSCLCPGPTRTEFGEVAGFRGNGLFERVAMTSGDVVATGLMGLERNRAVVVAGLLNRIGAASTRFVPRFVVRKIVGAIKY